MQTIVNTFKKLTLWGLGGFLLPFLAFSQSKSEQKLIEKAAKIHQKALTLDTHADVPIMMAKEGFDIGQKHDWENDGSQIDFPRMKEGGMDAMFFAVYVGQGKRTPEGNAEAKEKALKIFDLIHGAVKKYPDVAELALTAADARRIHKTGKRIVLIGMENGWCVGRDLANLDLYYNLGLRYITLSHSFNNDICDSSTDPEGAEYQGLSPYGEQVVKRMNELGMMVDISHVSDSSFYDVLRLTKSPVIASHSSCRALCEHKRNMSDDMIRALGRNGGVIQINFVPDFVKKPSQQHEVSLKELRMKMMRAETTMEEQKQIDAALKKLKKQYSTELPTVQDVVNHIDHAIKLAGIDHVGIGMDMDGGGEVMGCQDVSQIGSVTLELLRRGYSAKDIYKIWGGNLLRVLEANEKVAKSLKL
jgi:membrane dipeptidase